MVCTGCLIKSGGSQFTQDLRKPGYEIRNIYTLTGKREEFFNNKKTLRLVSWLRPKSMTLPPSYQSFSR